MSETTLLRKMLLRASALGMRLFRNQVGVYKLQDGRWLTSGLCVGSSDLIGWTPVVVTSEMVGKTVAIFTAIETKIGNNNATDEQSRFIAAVQASGGFASVARSVQDLNQFTQSGQLSDADLDDRNRRVTRQNREHSLGHVASHDIDSARSHR